MSQTKAQLISDLVQALNFTGTASAPANGVFLSATNTLAFATNSGSRITIDSSGNLNIPNDSGKLRFGTGNDLQIYHDGSHSYVQDSGTGNLLLCGTRVNTFNSAANEILISAQENGPVELYYDGSKKFETTSGGVLVTGDFDSTTGIFERTSGFTSQLKFNSSNETQLIHGSNGQVKLSFIGTGNAARGFIDGQSGFIRIKTATDDTGVICRDNSSTDLRFDDSTKLETTSTGVTVTGQIISDGLQMGDSERAKFGSHDDLQIYHDGTNSYVDEGSGTGALIFKSNTYSFRNAADSEQIAIFNENGAVELYHDNSKKFETASDRVNIYGHVFAIGGNYYISNGFQDAYARFRNTGGSNDANFEFFVRDSGTETEALEITKDAHIRIPNDNKKLKIGANDDLQIYHDGSDSYIKHNGTGNFYVQTAEAAVEDLFLQAGNDVYIRVQTGETAIKSIGNGAVELYHDGSKKFETTSSGVTINAGARFVGPAGQKECTWSNSTGILNVQDSGKATFGNSDDLQIFHDGGDNHIDSVSNAHKLKLQAEANIELRRAGANEVMAAFSPNGAVELYYDNSKKLETKTGGVIVEGSQLSLNDSNACIFFNTSSSGFGANIGIGRASTNNFHVTGSQAGELVIAAEYEKRIIFGLTTNTSGAPTIKMTMHAGGQIDGNFNDTSDAKLKENINPIPDNAITDVKQLKPVTFDWKDPGANNNVSGFIAQELKEVLPNLVNGKEWSEEDQSNRYTINTIGVVAHLTKALQEAITKIETLEAKVAR